MPRKYQRRLPLEPRYPQSLPPPARILDDFERSAALAVAVARMEAGELEAYPGDSHEPERGS